MKTDLSGEIRLALTWMRMFARETAQAANQHEHDLAVMYSLMRGFRPDAYIELGRGQGCSTLMASMAVAANGTGKITSFDLHSNFNPDLFGRLRDRIDIELREGDICDLTMDSWVELTKGCRRVAVLVDAHEETGGPISDVLIPFVKSRPDIKWALMFHDVLLVEDPELFAAFASHYQKSAPFVSPYPEYARIFSATKDMSPTHFVRLGAGMDVDEFRVLMPPGRSGKHQFSTDMTPDEIERRFSALNASSMMAVLMGAD